MYIFSIFFSSFLHTFEGSLSDLNDELKTDISECFSTKQQDGETVYIPLNAQGKIAQSLLDKASHNYLIQLYCPLQNIGSLIPSNVDIGLKIQFTDPKRFFVTSQAGKKPKFVIKV